jgi:hypothetical protein
MSTIYAYTGGKRVFENHQLCWVLDVRHYRKLDVMTDAHRELRVQVLAILYEFYKKIKIINLGKISKQNIQADFDHIKQQRLNSGLLMISLPTP